MTSSNHFTVLRAGEQRMLHGDLHTGTLMVHLGIDRPTRLDVAGFALTYKDIEVVGEAGTAEIVNGGVTLTLYPVAKP